MTKPKIFTHSGVISGDARAGGRKGRIKLRLTPSGSHWVDSAMRRFPRKGGGYVGDDWPMWFLDADTIGPLAPASGIEGEAGDPKGLHPKGESPAREAGDAQ